MKKLFALLLAAMMIFSLAACGEKGSGEPTDVESLASKILDEAEELDSFSQEAVEHYLKAYGIAYDDLKPTWEYEVSEKGAYADDPDSSGHAVVVFKNPNGELSDQQIKDYYQQVFNATAAASDDGYNIIGHEFVGDGENPADQTTLDEALNSFLQGWCFRKDGKNMVVYVSDIYDNDKESQYDRLFYYYGVKFDIGMGLQKSFDDTLNDAESALEEYEDEIKDALN